MSERKYTITIKGNADGTASFEMDPPNEVLMGELLPVATGREQGTKAQRLVVAVLNALGEAAEREIAAQRAAQPNPH